MWWLAGPLAVFLVTIVPVGFMVLRLVELTRTDAVIPLDGATHAVRVETDSDRMIWVDVGAPTPDCQVRDARSGDQVELHRVNLKTVREGEAGDESGRWQFDPGSGDLEITCSSTTAGGSASIGAAVTGRIMLTSFLPWFLLAMLLSAVWIGWLAVLVVKLARRSSEPPPPPAWTRPG
jgi:hypothetical protein